MQIWYGPSLFLYAQTRSLFIHRSSVDLIPTYNKEGPKGCKFKCNHPAKVVDALQTAVAKVVATKESANKRVKSEVITQ